MNKHARAYANQKTLVKQQSMEALQEESEEESGEEGSGDSSGEESEEEPEPELEDTDVVVTFRQAVRHVDYESGDEDDEPSTVVKAVKEDSEAFGKVDVGAKVIKVGSYWAEGKPFDEVIEMIQQPMRPINITFRPAAPES